MRKRNPSPSPSAVSSSSSTPSHYSNGEDKRLGQYLATAPNKFGNGNQLMLIILFYSWIFESQELQVLMQSRNCWLWVNRASQGKKVIQAWKEILSQDPKAMLGKLTEQISQPQSTSPQSQVQSQEDPRTPRLLPLKERSKWEKFKIPLVQLHPQIVDLVKVSKDWTEITVSHLSYLQDEDIINIITVNIIMVNIIKIITL